MREDHSKYFFKLFGVNPFERGEIGPDLFAAACRMGLEGLVSKRRDRPYQLQLKRNDSRRGRLDDLKAAGGGVGGTGRRCRG